MEHIENCDNCGIFNDRGDKLWDLLREQNPDFADCKIEKLWNAVPINEWEYINEIRKKS